MKFDALYHANFTLLSEAVTDWGTLVTSLAQLQKDAETGLHQAANKANWAGVNQQVSKEFIGKTAGEFADAHTQANSIYRILEDTLGELKGFHQQLTTAVSNANTKGFSVLPNGDGFMVTLTTRPQDPAGKEPDRTAEMTAVRDDIQKILNQASTSDSSAATVLKALVDQSELGFSGADYKDRDSAAEAVKEADNLARLAKKDPHDLTVKEFDQLNAGFKKYADDPLFAERFAATLGPQKTLEFWSGLTDGRNYDVVDERRDQLDDLQRGLSLTLAGASQSDSSAMTAWKRDMTGLGATRIGGDSGPMGFQVMSNLMRVGDYDDKFLTGYGNRLMAEEKQLTAYGQQPNRVWQFGGAGGTYQRLNFLGDDTGADPLTGYMRGLANSPDAATTFFNAEYVAKDDPNNPFERDSDDENSYKGKVGLSNFQYLFEERDWPQETNLKGDDLHTGQNYMAMALEAATTGHPAGEMPTADTPPHNSQQTKLFESIISSISQKDTLLTGNGYMSDSMGQITAEYMPDIHRQLSAGKNDEALYPVVGSVANPGEKELTRFLYALGRNPEGYAAVNLGQYSYTTQLMHHHFTHPGVYLDPGFSQSDSLKQGMEGVAKTAGQIEGIIAAGRAYENEVRGAEADAEYNSALESAGTWGGTVIGIGIGMATAPMTGPGGAVIGDVAGTVADELIGSITGGMAKDSTDEIVYRNGSLFNDTRDSTYSLVEEAAKKAGEAAGQRHPLIEGSVANAAESGFDTARSKINDYIEGEGVPRSLDSEG
ncbi:hypothetical protein IAG44_24555 [Streptomyces roseirectus]|uniref:Uncharacterized protein n=1 Tax=Streptomyces roseirectus TaxID=2768066 RepID=A0A7H0IHK8_9ACTN|nr:hypothetical protein [Streptomyces roseirectus]QNP72274.1 hypothetical protein IAG44_24555 [Streptomyces roseirectus]